MNKKEEDETRFQIALDCRDKEIELFWKRSSHYWLFVGSSLVAYVALRSQGIEYSLIVASFGLISSAAWMMSTVGSKWWIENWEQKLHKEAKNLGFQDLFIPEKSIRNRFSLSRDLVPIFRYSPSRPAVLISIFSTVIWALIFMSEAMHENNALKDFFLSLSPTNKNFIAVLTMLFVLVFFFLQGKDRNRIEQDDPDNPVNSPENSKNKPND